MKLSELLKRERITLTLGSETKEGVIEELFRLLVNSGEVKDAHEFMKSIEAREVMESTGIGNGIAIPHGITDAVRSVICAVGISERGIDYGSLDGRPVHLVFLLGIPTREARQYLGLLAQICRLFGRGELPKEITHATSVGEVLESIAEREATVS